MGYWKVEMQPLLDLGRKCRLKYVIKPIKCFLVAAPKKKKDSLLRSMLNFPHDMSQLAPPLG